MDANLLTSVSSIVLSLGFSYIPNLNTWFAALDTTKKRIIMAGLLLLVAAGSFGISCAGLPWVNITCDQAGIVGLVEALVWALIANQAAFLLSPETKAVVAVKAAKLLADNDMNAVG